MLTLLVGMLMVLVVSGKSKHNTLSCVITSKKSHFLLSTWRPSILYEMYVLYSSYLLGHLSDGCPLINKN